MFIKIDLRKVYYRIRIKNEEEWKTAFKTRYKHYEYIVMPFSLINAPATMQALINDTLREYLDRFCVVYLDNILIYSNNTENYVRYVSLVLKVLRERELLIKLEKCEWYIIRTGFLGHIVIIEGL